MSAPAKLVVAALLAVSILRAFYGAPPKSAHRSAALKAAALGGCGYLAAVAIAWDQHVTDACVLLVAAVETLCLAVWLLRGSDDGFDGHFEHEPDPPFDWEEFDRVRERWARPRTPAGVQ